MEAPGNKAVTIKAMDGGYTLAGWGVIYGGVDLQGETFTKDTDFWFDRLSPTPLVLYQHGQDGALKQHVLGRATVEPQDMGLWVEAQVALSDKYAEAIRELAEKGALGWSSGAVGHLAARDGKTITSWPIVEFSLTPTPAEPRTLGVHELRSLAESEPAVKALLPEEGEEPSAGATDGGIKAERIRIVDRKEPEMAEEDVKTTPAIDVAAIAAEAAQKAVAEMWEQMKALPAIGKQIDLTPEGKDHPETKSFGDFCVAVMRGDTKRLENVYKSTKATKAELAETSGTVGGYLVPTEHSGEIMRVATENSFIRARARIIPMTTREYDMPALDYSGTDADEPHSLGGVVMNWTEEGGTKTESEPTFDNITLKYHELSGYTIASNMLRQDAPGLEALLTQLFGTAIGWFEDWAFLRGNGAGKPLGVFNSGCLLAEVAASSTFVLSDAAAMMEMFMSSSPSAGVWVMHPKVLHLLIAMADGSGASNNLIWQPNARDSVPQSLFGKPIIFSEKMPVLPPGTSAATKGGVLLADFSHYLIGDRKQIAIDFSEHYKFIENKGTWRVCEYVDGQPWMKTYRTLADGSTTVSPFVTLKGA
jgi:HK97 family phage major capsid protein